MPAPQIVSPDRSQLFIESRDRRSRAESKSIQQMALLHFVENAGLAQALVMEEWVDVGIAERNQLEHPHLRRAQSRRPGGKLVEQVAQGRLEQRQCAQIGGH